MAKFKVGDILTGVKGSSGTYGITNEHSTLEVIEVIGKPAPYTSDLRVKVLTTEDGNYIGETYPVSSEYFELVKSKKTYVGIKTELEKKYTIEHQENIGTTFIRVGDITIAVPVPKDHVSISVKHPDDVECPEIGKAVAFYRLVNLLND